MSDQKNLEFEKNATDECPYCKKFVPPSPVKWTRWGDDQARIHSNYTYRGWESVWLLKWAIDGYSCFKKNQNLKIEDNYHLIVIAHYEKSWIRNVQTYASGIDLLIRYFKKTTKKISFKINCCKNSRDFIEAVKEPGAQSIWIFGHGYAHRVYFSDKEFLPYCKFKNTKEEEKKRFIAQLHCSVGEGKGLGEYLAISGKTDIFNGDIRTPLKNREDIKKWIDNQKE